MNRYLTLALVLPLAAALSCAGSAWKRALREDSIAGYHRFVRDHPRSSRADLAKEHIAFLKVRKEPTASNLAAFNKKYPETRLGDRMQQLLEDLALRSARVSGTVAAYQRFLNDFPETKLAERIEGNVTFLEARQFVGMPEQLSDFASQHPSSDYANEVRRSVESLAVHRKHGFERVGLEIEIAPGTPEAERLREKFSERAVVAYETTPVDLVLAGADGGYAGDAPDVRLVIRHREESVGTDVEQGELLPGVVGRTQVILQQRGVEAPVWSREFSVRISPQDHLAGTSVVFAPAAQRFWRDFFVPISSWPSNASVRTPVEFPKPVVAVDAVTDRAAVLFEDGDFQVLSLADPNDPVVLAEYQRPDDLQHFDDVRLMGNGAAVFGEDGLEVIQFSGDGPRRILALGRGEIGSVFALEFLGRGDLLVGGSQGMFAVPLNGAKPRRIMRRFVLGMAKVRGAVIFSDGESIAVSTLEMLQGDRVYAQLRLGKEFGPRRIRVFGSQAAVIGKTAVLMVDLTDPSNPRVRSRIRFDDTGRVYDVTRAGDRLFLIGDRGLQAVDRRLDSVAETIEVRGSARIDSIGRHVVTVGDRWLQVVDATPYIGTREDTPASPRN